MMEFDTSAIDAELNTKRVKCLNNFHFDLLIFFFFLTVSALRSHVRECGIGAQCPLCPKIVTQKRNLPKHMEKHKRDGLWGSLQELQEKYPDYVHENYDVIIKDEIQI